jgi:hypothetical protein
LRITRKGALGKSFLFAIFAIFPVSCYFAILIFFFLIFNAIFNAIFPIFYFLVDFQLKKCIILFSNYKKKKKSFLNIYFLL